jgi:ribonuclease BN (tRNA processing enzyme)
MRRFGVVPNKVATVFLSHLHGDHVGGMPFLILDAQHTCRRITPLTIAGPPGVKERLRALMESMFPESSAVNPQFALNINEIPPEAVTPTNGVDPALVNGFPAALENADRLGSEVVETIRALDRKNAA